ncbi:Flp pilus assembly complex ATPase component TadA [Candidatus Woesearchaeota archaeon]|nr:Flp pilus assembly complex ATPase component TadA [Candidatus Woesearchaeota archaeon]HIJ01522.1 Flp pilus assembly complex ATPase component TadA [Candidatus Woesearchaeota archaeon]HIJ13741.1 Flp pilus assembly complex ATPase component TadA [Candidatus Woesearchaeota archaeon]
MDKLVPDTSVLVEGILSRKIEAEEILPKEIIIHEASLSELEAQSNTGREIGFMGLEEIKKLNLLSEKHKFIVRFLGDKPTEHEISNAKKGGIDSLIRNLAFNLKAALVTVDKVQALVAEAKGVEVILIQLDQSIRPLTIEKFFDEKTMSIHLKENCKVKAKKGVPGNWEYVQITEQVLDKDTLKDIAKEIVEDCSMRSDGFIEIERKHSTIIQLGKFRIVITRPPFADGYEITIVRPVKKLNFNEYDMSEKLRRRIMEQAEGILIAGAPGHGKSTFAQALAEYYLTKNKVVKTVEAPRDLILNDEITQYAISHGTYEEIHDILLLSRPDYTLFDEMRNTKDFELFSDLRLAGVGMIGIVHATNPIDAIQRFIGRIELGVIPHIMDTVIFIKNGGIAKAYSVEMEVKVPSGMVEADLARPVVVVNDFESGKLEFEIYSYGEETVVIPVKKETISPAAELAAKIVKQEFMKYSDFVRVDMVSNNKAVVFVPAERKPMIIGKSGSNIDQIEKKLGLSIDVREINEKSSERSETVPYQVKIDKKNITFLISSDAANKDTDIYIGDDYILTVKSSKKSIIKINKQSNQGREIMHSLNEGEKVELRQ